MTLGGLGTMSDLLRSMKVRISVGTRSLIALCPSLSSSCFSFLGGAFVRRHAFNAQNYRNLEIS